MRGVLSLLMFHYYTWSNVATINGGVFIWCNFCPVLVRGNALRQGSSWRGSRGPMALLLVALSICGVALWLYMPFLDSDITETLVRQAELISPLPRAYTVQCSTDYENYKRYPGNGPTGNQSCISLLCKHGLDEIKPSLHDKYRTNLDLHLPLFDYIFGFSSFRRC